jgi:hypothetical protein
MFTAEAFGPAVLIIGIFTFLDFQNLGFLGAMVWLYFSKRLDSKGAGFLMHYLWSKGFILKKACRGVPSPTIREYKR